MADAAARLQQCRTVDDCERPLALLPGCRSGVELHIRTSVPLSACGPCLDTHAYRWF